MRSRAEPVSRETFEQGESIRVDPRSGGLCWVDMRVGTVHLGQMDDGVLWIRTSAQVPGGRVGMAAPAGASGWVVAGGDSLWWWEPEDDAWTPLLEGLTPDRSRFLNDGVCDPAGRLWVGSQSVPREPTSALLRIDPDLTVTTVLEGVTVSNGIGFSPDGSLLYYIDTLPYRRLEAFDVVRGELSGRRTVTTLEGGNPDGLVVDAEGCAWVAMWDASEVRRVSQSGEVVDVVEVPARRPSACTISDGVLYVTTARVGLTDPGPDEGRIFAVEVGVDAPPASTWAGQPPTRSSKDKESAAWV